jgi:hypothetical protein
MIVRDMTQRWFVVGLLALSPVLVNPTALAQQSPAPAAKQAPPPEDLEPGVDTSKMPAGRSSSDGGASTQSTSPGSSGASAPAPSSDEHVLSAPKDSKPTSDSAAATSRPAKGAKRASNPSAGTATNSSGKGGKAEDHLTLDTTDITGNQELPKVLYIVPWKKSDLGDLLGRPANSLLDEVLQPVDRDVFKRENRYYDALKPDSASGKGTDAGAGATSPGSGDKR